MPSKKIVLDTNCLLVSISKYGEAYPVWRGFLDGRYTLCVSTEILEEYEETEDGKQIATICSITELSNHYKKK